MRQHVHCKRRTADCGLPGSEAGRTPPVPVCNRRRYLGLLLTVPVLAIAAGCTKIGPDETGVRTVNFGEGKGIVQAEFEPGYHRYLWPLDTWHRFPSTAQHVRFSKEASRAPGDGTALQLTSADGDRVAMNADVFFRIAEDAAYKVLQDSGPGDRYRAIVLSEAQHATRVVFGTLRTEDFYNQERREAVRRRAADLLRGRLEPRGLELIDLLVESIEFETNYEKLIKEKKIFDQQVELEEALARAAEEKGKVARIRVDTDALVQAIRQEKEAAQIRMEADRDAQIAVIKAEAGKYTTERRADGELYTEQKKAEGQRLINLAEADGANRLNQALSGEGGRNLVAIEALKKLNLREVTFPSIDYDWLNPYEMAIRVGASTGTAVPDAPGGAETPLATVPEVPLAGVPALPATADQPVAESDGLFAVAEPEAARDATGSDAPLATAENP